MYKRQERKGIGAKLGGAWAHYRWPKLIRSTKVCPSCGVQWKFKMNMLELVGKSNWVNMKTV